MHGVQQKPQTQFGVWGFCFVSKLNLKLPKIRRLTATWSVVLSSSLAAEAEPEALALAPALAWLLASVEEERAYFEVAELVVGELEAAPVVGVVAEELVAAAAAESPVAGAAAVALALVCFEPVAAPAADALVAEPVAGAVAAEPELACSEPAEALAADALAVELAAELVAVWLQADWQEVGCDSEARLARAPVLPRDRRRVDYGWAAAELVQAREQARAARRAVRRVVDWAEHFVARRWVVEMRWVAELDSAAALR